MALIISPTTSTTATNELKSSNYL